MLFALLSCISVIRPRRIAPHEDETLPTVQEIAQRLHNRIADHPERSLSELRHQWLGYVLGCTDPMPSLPIPDIDDIIVLCYGIPVVPWLKRIGVHQWQNWLDRLGDALRARYPDRLDIVTGAAWDEWLARHVRYVETHFARIAGQRIAQLISALPSEPGKVYLFGHSRADRQCCNIWPICAKAMPPARPIRAALTLNAAVSGPARAWTAWPIAPANAQ